MKIRITILLLCIFGSFGIAQESIDGEVNFQGVNKKYSLFIPSAYDGTLPINGMLGLHPFNVNRWNSETWRDFLIDFADEMDLFLICPDGGPDGRIDDPIDTAFTSYLLDSMFQEYNIDKENLYVMGFSWGGRTTYTYGLARPAMFKGFMPIGAAINGLNEIGGVVANAKDKPVYIIHGSRDNPANRYTPAKNALINAGACVKDSLMPGVGHTVDVQGINEIFKIGYQYLKEINCNLSSGVSEDVQSLDIVPNPMKVGESIDLVSFVEDIHTAHIYDLKGKLVMSKSQKDLTLVMTTSGVFNLQIVDKNGQVHLGRLVVID